MPLRKKAIEWGPDIPCNEPKRHQSFSLMLDVFPNLYERLQEDREGDWWKTVKAFEANPNSVYNAYYYIANHPMFYYWHVWRNHVEEGVAAVHERHLIHDQGWESVHIDPHMIDPNTGKISDDEHLNTKVEWWYEYGPTLYQHMDGDSPGIRGHDWKRDGGADTYDEAIIKVAKSIHRYYGNDRVKVQEIWKDPALPTLPEVKRDSVPRRRSGRLERLLALFSSEATKKSS